MLKRVFLSMLCFVITLTGFCQTSERLIISVQNNEVLKNSQDRQQTLRSNTDNNKMIYISEDQKPSIDVLKDVYIENQDYSKFGFYLKIRDSAGLPVKNLYSKINGIDGIPRVYCKVQPSYGDVEELKQKFSNLELTSDDAATLATSGYINIIPDLIEGINKTPGAGEQIIAFYFELSDGTMRYIAFKHFIPSIPDDGCIPIFVWEAVDFPLLTYTNASQIGDSTFTLFKPIPLVTISWDFIRYRKYSKKIDYNIGIFASADVFGLIQYRGQNASNYLENEFPKLLWGFRV